MAQFLVIQYVPLLYGSLAPESLTSQFGLVACTVKVACESGKDLLFASLAFGRDSVIKPVDLISSM